jgi:amino acid transporter
LAELAKELFGEFGFLSILLLSFIAVWSTLSSIFTLLPRVLFAGAQDGLMPKILAKIHPRYNTPYLAIVFLGILGFAFAASGSFQYLLILVTGASLVLYFGAILAFFKLRIIDKRSGGDVFKVKGGYLIGSITLVALGWVFSQLQATEIQGISIFIGILVVIYYILNYFKIKNSNQLL